MLVEVLLNLNNLLAFAACALVIYFVASGRLKYLYAVKNDPSTTPQQTTKPQPTSLPKAEIPAHLMPLRNLPKTLGIPRDQLMDLPSGHVLNARERRIAPEMLAQCKLDGKALWMGCYSQADKLVVIFDVSSRPDFYGVGGSYSMLTGRDASYQLGAMALSAEALQKYDISQLTGQQQKTLFEWYTKLKEKYPIVGYLWPHQTGLSLRDPEGPVEEEEPELPFHDYKAAKQAKEVAKEKESVMDGVTAGDAGDVKE